MRIALTPNEKRRLIEEEKKKRRITRLNQVRQQAREAAARLRRAVQEESEKREAQLQERVACRIRAACMDASSSSASAPSPPLPPPLHHPPRTPSNLKRISIRTLGRSAKKPKLTEEVLRRADERGEIARKRLGLEGRRKRTEAEIAQQKRKEAARQANLRSRPAVHSRPSG